jgi:two-component system catabolic regulation response regulator CreB
VLRRTRTVGGADELPAMFTVDDGKRQIRFFGEPLDLSKYEYNLLTVFIGRPGHVFSRDRLMELAWDEPEASMDRTVDAHIKNLRAKLKAIRPDIDPIVTHRGTGYAMKETP